MNHYNLHECYVGMRAEFEAVITEENMNSFRAITGDNNPLHNNEKFARDHGYKGRVSFGLLSSSFASTLAGVYLPGEKSLIHEVSFKFMKPVYIGDHLTVSGEVIELDDRTEQISLKVRVRRKEDGAIVLRGKMIVGFLQEI